MANNLVTKAVELIYQMEGTQLQEVIEAVQDQKAQSLQSRIDHPVLENRTGLCAVVLEHASSGPHAHPRGLLDVLDEPDEIGERIE